MFEGFFNGFWIVFILIFVFSIAMFIGVFMIIFNGKARTKFLGKQLKIQKQMLESNKDTLQDIGEISNSIGINIRKNTMDSHKDDLEDIASMNADINKDAIKTTVGAIREGFTGKNTKYCKYCGEIIDSDSIFCNKCEKKQ